MDAKILILSTTPNGFFETSIQVDTYEWVHGGYFPLDAPGIYDAARRIKDARCVHVWSDVDDDDAITTIRLAWFTAACSQYGLKFNPDDESYNKDEENDEDD